MKPRITIAVLVLLSFSVGATAQKIKVTNGKIKDLAGVEKIRIEYDYSDLGVGKFDVEEEYIAEKVAEYNEDEAGKGDQWREAWFNDRPTRYEPKFEELFSDYAEFIESGQNVDSDVIMQVHTTFIEPGFNVGVARKPASINLDIKFIQGNKFRLRFPDCGSIRKSRKIPGQISGQKPELAYPGQGSILVYRSWAQNGPGTFFFVSTGPYHSWWPPPCTGFHRVRPQGSLSCLPDSVDPPEPPEYHREHR